MCKHILIIIGLVISISLFCESDLILSVLLGFSLLLFWYMKIYRTEDIATSIIMGIGLSIGEIIIIKYGAWSYTNVVSIPIWLVFAWCHTVIAIRKISNTIWLRIYKIVIRMENKNESKHD